MWILIFSVLTANAPAVTTQEFASQKACVLAYEKAASTIEAGSLEAGTKVTVRGVCVRKS